MSALSGFRRMSRVADQAEHGVVCSFAEIARQLRIIIGDEVTDDEIIMAAHLVRAQWRHCRHVTGARPHLAVIEANCARWRAAVWTAGGGKVNSWRGYPPA